MKSVIILLLIGTSLSIFSKVDDTPFITKEQTLSAKNYSFKTYDYESHPFKNWTMDQVKNLMGIKHFTPMTSEIVNVNDEELPESFDARTQWPDCVHAIRDQGHCGSCWAFAASEVLSDRFCIASKGSVNVVLSPQDFVSCDFFDHGCNWGNPMLSWVYLKYFGIASDDCRPYTSSKGEVEKCDTNCTNGWQYKKYKAGDLPTILAWNVEAIKKSLMTQGPVETGFQVYKDFMSYAGGVYVHHDGDLLWGHAVKIVGWWKENGVEHWIVANSWWTGWWENGFFRIKMGECGFESMAVASTADLTSLQ